MNKLTKFFPERRSASLPVVQVEDKREALRLAVPAPAVVMAVFWLCLFGGEALGAITFTTLFNFPGTNGALPEAALIEGADGFLYGTTLIGGSNNFAGTVFRIAANGEFTSLASLHALGDPSVQPGLVLGQDGNFYGTYSRGTNYWGGVFKMTPEGVLTKFASFAELRTSDPNGLAVAPDGNFYGTTYYGGDFDNGTLFRLTTNGSITILVSFAGTNGAHPQMTLRADASGNLYGTTTAGGTNGGWGTVFRCTLEGHLTSLFSFNGTNGAGPLAAPLLARDGSLYGTTSGGGVPFTISPFEGGGTVYRITPRRAFTNLAVFHATNGSRPSFNGLIQSEDGQLYGTASSGSDKGSVFRITTNGALTKLISFNGANGGLPWAGLLQASDGAFYGVTGQGGAYGFGTVFRMDVAPEPVPGTAMLKLIAVEDETQQWFGRVDYLRRLGTSRATITIFSNAHGDNPSLRGGTTFTVTSNALRLASFATHPHGFRVLAPVTLTRSGSLYTGMLELVGSPGQTTARDPTRWTIEITDWNDADADGIADISDVGPPVILLPPKSRTVKAGGAVVLTSRARGEGPLQFQWLLNGLDLVGATNRTLRINHIQFAQAGDYRVVVAGPGGTVSSTAAQITVR